MNAPLLAGLKNKKTSPSKTLWPSLKCSPRAPFPVWRTSGTGRLIWVNPAYVKAVGAATEAAVLQEQVQLDNQSAEDSKSVLSSLKTTETTRNIVMGGRHQSVRLVLFPISGGAVGMAMDATETEGLRNTLTRHIRAHDEMLNTMDEAIVIFGSDQKVSFHNTAFATMFNLDPGWGKKPS